MGAHTALAITHYFAGNFEISGQYAMRAVQIWRSGGVAVFARRARRTCGHFFVL